MFSITGDNDVQVGIKTFIKESGLTWPIVLKNILHIDSSVINLTVLYWKEIFQNRILECWSFILLTGPVGKAQLQS